MKLLYTGSPMCSLATLKRLLIVAEEIAFMDRPSVTFENWGTVGVASLARSFLKEMEGQPVRLSVHAPPSGPAGRLYEEYIKADLADDEFRRVVLEGLGSDAEFGSKLLQFDAYYGSRTGREIAQALGADEALRRAPVADAVDERMYNIADEQGRRVTLRVLVTEASIHATSALLMARETGLIPVSDDPFSSHLLALRTARPYVDGIASVAPMLGLAVAQAVIPDEALQKLEPRDILEYRRSVKDAYDAWSAELNSFAAKLDDIPAADLKRAAARLVATEITPKLHLYENEMKSARDKLFGDLIKKIASWRVATLSVAYLAWPSFGTAAIAFANALLPAVPTVVDYFQKRAEVKRNHAQSYLIALANDTTRASSACAMPNSPAKEAPLTW